MNFYLGVRKSSTAISNDEAATRFRALSDEKSVEPEFDDQVYAFYSRLISHTRKSKLVPENELDACPWACALNVAGD